jgi:putative transposase
MKMKKRNTDVNINPYYYKNKYRIDSNRLDGYDYGSNGYYFITICTKDRIEYFGKIVNGKMQLSKNSIGSIIG